MSAGKELEHTFSSGYEFGRIISTGMIGMVYVSRDTLHPLFGLVCIKRMMGSYMAEKNIFPAVKREVQILNDIRGIKGCIQLQNII